MIKHFLHYVLFLGTMFAAGAAPLGGGGGSDSGAGGTPPGAAVPGSGAGSPGTGGTPGGPGSQPGAGQPGAQPGAGAGDQGLKQLREAYEGVKAKFEPYEKLNLKPEQISQYSTVYQKVQTEAANIGRELGYSDEEIAEALMEDPIRTLDFLRHQATQQQQDPNNGQDLRKQVEEQVSRAIGPIQQRENVRITNEANAIFERTVHSEAVNLFKSMGIEAANIPQDEMQLLMDATAEILKYDQAALKELKYSGKTAGVQKAFKDAVSALDKYYLARSGRERARVNPPSRGGQQQQQGGQQPAKKPTLDEIINGDENAVSQMSSMRER